MAAVLVVYAPAIRGGFIWDDKTFVTENHLITGSGGLSPTVTGKASPFSFRRVDGKNGTVDISGRDGDPSSISCDDVNAFASELEQLAPPPDTSTACN